MLESLEDWAAIIDEYNNLDVIYIDFSKAFDKVCHRLLLIKLEAYGVKGKVLRWINEYLTGLTQQVVIHGATSSSLPVLSGVPQGSVIGPIMFLLYINDLPEMLSCTSKLFADDAKVYSKNSTQEEREHLQNNIDTMCRWSDQWLMTLNIEKCKHMEMGPREKSTSYNITHRGAEHTLQKVDIEKDLGVHIDKSLSFNTHIQKTTNKANQIVGIIFRSFTYMSQDIFVKLYKSLVRPHLEYASVVWSPLHTKDKRAIESVQRRSTKRIPSLRGKSYPERLLALGLPTLEYRRERADMLQVFKILNNIDVLEMDKLFTLCEYRATRGHSKKLYKRPCKKHLVSGYFSNRVITPWNALPEHVVSAPSVNCFKARLNQHWKNHPRKFEPSFL